MKVKIDDCYSGTVDQNDAAHLSLMSTHMNSFQFLQTNTQKFWSLLLIKLKFPDTNIFFTARSLSIFENRNTSNNTITIYDNLLI